MTSRGTVKCEELVSTLVSRYALFVVIAAIVLLAATNDLFSSSVIVMAAQLLAVWPGSALASTQTSRGHIR
jgi:hypothetical protein